MRTGFRQQTSIQTIVTILLCGFAPLLHAHADFMSHTHLAHDSILYHFGNWAWLAILALVSLPALYYLHIRLKRHIRKDQSTDIRN